MKHRQQDACQEIDLLRGRGQVPLRHAVRISLGWSLRSRETLFHTLLWGTMSSLINALMSPPAFRPAAVTGSLAFAFTVGYLAPVLWRWRLVPKGASRLTMYAANGAATFVFGYVAFFCTIVGAIFLFHGLDAMHPTFLKRMMVLAMIGFIFPIIGYNIVSGIDLERLTARRERQRARLERLADEARLVALRAQINPHFFFNALNTIAALIPREPEKAERAVELLATSLRPVLTREQPMLAPLADELRVARAYAEIERLRFGDRVAFEFDVADGTDDALLPSLSLQPLLENAIAHGAAHCGGRYRVRLTARRQNGALCIEIANHPEDGKRGDMRPVTPRAGHALHNIATRLRALFGPEASLDVRIGDGPSALACLRVPTATPEAEVVP
jgi:sensor histidine kinase YesM